MLKFNEKNVNFKNKTTTDCVVRAIATATGKEYKEIAKELFDNYMKTGYAMNDRKNYEKWLEQNGWYKIRQPRKSDNTKYLIGEANDYVTIKKNRVVIMRCAHHLTCKVDNELIDIWDCRYKCIGNYWIKEN